MPLFNHGTSKVWLDLHQKVLNFNLWSRHSCNLNIQNIVTWGYNMNPNSKEFACSSMWGLVSGVPRKVPCTHDLPFKIVCSSAADQASNLGSLTAGGLLLPPCTQSALQTKIKSSAVKIYILALFVCVWGVCVCAPNNKQQAWIDRHTNKYIILHIVLYKKLQIIKCKNKTNLFKYTKGRNFSNWSLFKNSCVITAYFMVGSVQTWAIFMMLQNTHIRFKDMFHVGTSYDVMSIL